jgi:hypothetical protein
MGQRKISVTWIEETMRIESEDRNGRRWSVEIDPWVDRVISLKILAAIATLATVLDRVLS